MGGKGRRYVRRDPPVNCAQAACHATLAVLACVACRICQQFGELARVTRNSALLIGADRCDIGPTTVFLATVPGGFASTTPGAPRASVESHCP